jgi:hypothetical protein
VGDAAKIRDQVKGYGVITEMTLTEPSFEPEPGAALAAA